jgi:NAD(P)H-quinone oxidoreductase subunit 5
VEQPLAALVLLAPAGFVLAAALRSVAAVRIAAATGLVVAGAAAVAVGSGGTRAGTLVRLDPLSVLVLGMISVLAVVIVRFSTSYLAGDPRRAGFLARLALTIAAVELLVVSGNLVTLFVAWVLTSLALHRLLVFHPERPRAVLAARKKFVAARVGDVLLLVAVVLLARSAGSVELGAVFDHVRDAAGSVSVVVAALCLVLAAMLKAAMFPTHGWLVEVMETPTPVSALLHAGVLNAGPFLVLRTFPVVESVGAASLLLVGVGGTTAVLASLMRNTQTSVKVGLGYSSSGHMGFSLLLCGLGLVPAAALHLVAHSFYKAHAFLSSGSVVDDARAGHVPVPARTGSPARLALGAALALGVYLPIAWVWGVRPDTDPALFVLGAVIVLGSVQLVASVTDAAGPARSWLAATGLAAFVVTSFFAFEGLLHALLHDLAPQRGAGTAQLVVAAMVLVASAAVVVHQLRAPTRPDTPRRRAWRVHLRNGLYANAAFDRLVLRLWAPADRRRGTVSPSAPMPAVRY